MNTHQHNQPSTQKTGGTTLPPASPLHKKKGGNHPSPPKKPHAKSKDKPTHPPYPHQPPNPAHKKKGGNPPSPQTTLIPIIPLTPALKLFMHRIGNLLLLLPPHPHGFPQRKVGINRPPGHAEPVPKAPSPQSPTPDQVVDSLQRDTQDLCGLSCGKTSRWHFLTSLPKSLIVL